MVSDVVVYTQTCRTLGVSPHILCSPCLQDGNCWFSQQELTSGWVCDQQLSFWKNKSLFGLCNPQNLRCNLHLARTRNPSNPAQPVSEESWGSCCAQPAFQAKLTGGICRKLCRTGQVVDISPNRPMNLGRNLRTPHPQPWDSSSHIPNDGIIHIPEEKKKHPSNGWCLALCFLLLYEAAALPFCSQIWPHSESFCLQVEFSLLTQLAFYITVKL